MRFKTIREGNKQTNRVKKWFIRIENERGTKQEEIEIKRAKKRLNKHEFKLLCKKLTIKEA